ncbi:MAG: redoxin domain-containing protein, partial [Planctomycetota bacterium]
LLAVSTDAPETLAQSEFGYDEGRFPFPLVSDESLDVFRQYRVYDDFEETPLHGTFLIDGDGLIRWHDISYEPFNNPKFLLEEANRLLRQSKAQQQNGTPNPPRPYEPRGDALSAATAPSGEQPPAGEELLAKAAED